MDSNNSSDFALLPTHIIARILNLLNFHERLEATRTCKSWYLASYEPLFWKNIQVSIKGNLGRLDKMQRPFGKLFVKHIDFINWVYYYPDYFARFGQYIRELVLSTSTTTMYHLIDCLLLMPNLRTLNIVDCNKIFDTPMSLSDERADDIKPILNCIRNFKIVLNNDARYEGLPYFMRLMPNLKILEYIGINSDMYHYPRYVYGSLFDYFSMFREIINLDRLCIGHLRGSVLETFLSDFSKITQILNVRELVFHSIVENYDGKINEMIQQFFKKLSSVRILSMWLKGDNQLHCVCRYMTQLTEVKLYCVPNQKMQLIGSLQNLQKLTLNCSFYDPDMDDDLLGLFNKLSQLKSLWLNYTISEVIFNEICTSCTNLTKLELVNMKTNKLSVMFKNLTKLRMLRLKFWPGLQKYSDSLDCDITNLKLLEVLLISDYQPGMTYDHIVNLPNLWNDLLLKYQIGKAFYPSFGDTYDWDAD